jgi:hypothetical protein
MRLVLVQARESIHATRTSVYAKDLIVDDNAQSEKVKHVGEVVPHVGIAVLPRALCIEAVGLRNAPGLMVPSNQMYSVGVSQL